MASEERVFLECAEMIKKVLRGEERYQLNDVIQHFLSNRDQKIVLEKMYADFIKTHESTYNLEALEITKYVHQLGGKSEFPKGFVQIEVPQNQHLDKLTLPGTDTKVGFRQYFTLKPVSRNPDQAFQEIMRFLNLMKTLFQHLWGLAEKTGDHIRFKFPFTLRFLVNHTESLVIYHNNPNNNAAIQALVESLFCHHGLLLAELRGRFFRSGFDFNSLSKKYSASHNEILADLIAKELKKYPSAQILSLTEEKLAAWIQNLVYHFRDYNPKQAHQSLFLGESASI